MARGRILGTSNVPGLAAFDAQFGPPKIGLRDIYRSGLAKVDQIAQATAGAPFAKLARQPRTPCSKCWTAALSCLTHDVVA